MVEERLDGERVIEVLRVVQLDELVVVAAVVDVVVDWFGLQA